MKRECTCCPLLADILDVLPQRPPFVMVDNLVSCTQKDAATDFVIRPDNLFLERGKFSESGMLENVAQSCAAQIGYVSKYIRGERVRIGVIGSISKCAVSFLPLVGDRLETAICIEEEVFNMTLVSGRIMVCGREALSCNMKIFLTENEIK